MFKNYLKTAFRNLTKNKGFTAINVLGLALGLCVCMLIVFYVVDELSYDRYNQNADRIYRVNNDIKFAGSERSYAQSPAPLAATFKAALPEVENTVRFRRWGEYVVRKGNQNIHEAEVVFADTTLFNVFTIPMIQGNPSTALTEPRSVVINETIARKYFNEVNVVGQTLTFNDSLQYKVTGVIKDLPKQSHFNFEIFMSMSGFDESRDDSWLSNNFNTYLLLKPGTDIKRFEAKIPPLVHKNLDGQLRAAIRMSYAELEHGGSFFKINLTPLTDVHLRSNRTGDFGQPGNIQYVYIFSAVAIFILLIACVNFMNLSTARSANRAREVGVRKVLGSARGHLIAQFLAESLMVTLVATVIALVGAVLLLPVFNDTAGKHLELTSATFTWLAPALLLAVAIIGFLAGSYPAFYLSGFQPIQVLKGKLSAGFKSGYLRSFLVVFQFSISIFLIIGTIVIYNQLKFIQNKDLGYNRDHVLLIKNMDGLGNQAGTFKHEIQRIAGVKNASVTGFMPTAGWRNSSTFFQDETRDTKKALASQVWGVDAEYIPTMGMKILLGRNFSAGMKTDSTALIINEAAAKQLGMANPIDKELFLPLDNMAKKLQRSHIIGMVKDFNFNSLRENVTPLVFTLSDNRGQLAVLLGSSNLTQRMEKIKNKWQAFAPNQQFDYSFMDDDFDATYRTEQRIGKIFVAFTSMAIIIACLGLFGLAAYAAEQRTKEIGIRKVLGASTSLIVGMLSRNFIKLVIVSILVASPLAWLFIRQWFLNDFAYKDTIQWWVFASAGGGAILIAFITISFQSVKAALANPVKSLKTE